MPTECQILEWERDSAAFPAHLVPVGQDQWPGDAMFGGVAIGAYRSRDFVVVVWQEPNGITRLSVNRTDWDKDQARFRGDIGWDDLQRLKAEAGYGDVAAVEVYPPDRHVINTANMRHLFLMPTLPPFMWLGETETREAA